MLSHNIITRPKVSIIVPVWGVEEYIEECLRSVMNQTFDDFECLIVNDCTQDSSIDIARRVIAEYKGPAQFCILQRETNGGLSSARNTGLRAARGEYVLFLDSDDLITADCIELLYEAACRYPQAQLINGDYKMFPAELAMKQPGLRDYSFVPEFLSTHTSVASYWFNFIPVAAWNKLVKRNFLLDNELFFREKILFEDNHWKALMYPAIQSVVLVNRITYLYRMRPGSIMHSDDITNKRLENFKKIYSEFFSKPIPHELYYYKWIFTVLTDFKFGKIAEAKGIYKKFTKLLLTNNTVPKRIKAVISYHRIPRPWMRVAIVDLMLRMLSPS